jgi:hypothetical protein
MHRLAILCVALAFTGCAAATRGRVVTTRPAILGHPSVVRLDPDGDGSQVQAFLAAQAAGRTSGLCQGMSSVEATPSDWCIITEGGRTYWVIDYTNDPLGVDGYRIQPLDHTGGNRFYDRDSRQEVLLLPWLRD